MNRLFFAFTVIVAPFLISFALTPLVRMLATRHRIEDAPAPPRKQHSNPTPLLGGVAIFFAFIVPIILLFILDKIFSLSFFELCEKFRDVTACAQAPGERIVFAISFALFILLIGGILDDLYHLPPGLQIIWPIAAALIAVLGGVSQDNITNPIYFLGLSSDPLIHLNRWTIFVFNVPITFFSDFFAFCWIMLIMYATKLLDGLNGLVSGITIIGGIILFVAGNALGQGLPAVLALILASSYLGFLPYNFKGQIFLGESGSTIAGFLLGSIALLGPAKISITFLILGIPILDLLWVSYERIVKAKKSPFQGDLRHMHFKLVEHGLSSRQAVVALWLISAFFGLFGLFLQGFGQWVLIAALLGVMLFLIRITSRVVGDNEK